MINVGFFNSKHLTMFLLVVLYSSFRHQSSLIGSEDPVSFNGFRVGLLQDEPNLASTIQEAPSLRYSALPKKIDLAYKLPIPYPQGNQASSVGLVLGYLMKSYYENLKLDQPKDLNKISVSNQEKSSHFYSPSFVYNSINHGKDLGGSILDGLILLAAKGIPTWEEMPYSPEDYRSQKDGTSLNAYSHRINDFRKIPQSDIVKIKSYIAANNPLVASMLFFENFTQYKKGEILNQEKGKFLGAQAIAIIGYDDSKKAFKVWNSWGPSWGENGYAWISYSLFQKLGSSVYWMDDPANLVDPMDLALAYPNHIHATRGNYPDKVRISWDNVKNAIGYEIFRKRPSETKYTLVGLAIDNAFEDMGVQQDITYQYSVASVFSDQSSSQNPDPTEGYSSKSKVPITSMEITGLTASQGRFADKILIRWDPIPGIRNYHLYKYNIYSKEFRLLSKTAKPEFIDRKAQRNGNFEFYRVSVAGSFATSFISQSSFGFTTSRGISLPPPELVYATQGEYTDKINITWEEVQGAVDYKVYRYTKESNFWEELGQTANHIFDDTEPKSSNHYYAVSSLNKLGTWSRASLPVYGFISTQSMRSSSLNPPQELSIFEIRQKTTKENLLRLSWKPVQDAKEYRIYSKIVGGNWTVIGTSKSNYFQFPTQPASKFHLYSVSSVNDLDLEGFKSKSLSYGWHPITRDESTIRSFGSDSKLENFKGPWTSMYWDGKASVTPVRLKIESKDDLNQTYSIELNNKVIYEGDYLQENKIVDPQGSFKLELSASSDALYLEIKDKKILKENTTLSFLRE